MASLWTIIAFLIEGRSIVHWWHHSWWAGIPYPALVLIFTMLAVCGLNTVLDSIIQFFSRQPLEEVEDAVQIKGSDEIAFKINEGVVSEFEQVKDNL